MTNKKHIIMTNETQDIDLNNEAEGTVEQDETTEQSEETQERVTETPEAKRARLKRQLEQLEKKHPELSEKPKSSKKSDELDYGQEAFLIANGIKGDDESSLVKDIMANTGKNLKEVINSKYFQAELKEMRDLRATAEAIPQGKNRNGQSAQSTVDYWIAKGELPPASEVDLRRKVVNARIERESKKNVFYNK